MNLVKIVSEPQATNTQPEYFFVGDMVVNENTGERARIENIAPYPYAINGTFDHDVYCAYVIGWNAEMQSDYSDHWLYDDMSLLEPAY